MLISANVSHKPHRCPSVVSYVESDTRAPPTDSSLMQGTVYTASSNLSGTPLHSDHCRFSTNIISEGVSSFTQSVTRIHVGGKKTRSKLLLTRRQVRLKNLRIWRIRAGLKMRRNSVKRWLWEDGVENERWVCRSIFIYLQLGWMIKLNTDWHEVPGSSFVT